MFFAYSIIYGGQSPSDAHSARWVDGCGWWKAGRRRTDDDQVKRRANGRSTVLAGRRTASPTRICCRS